MQIVLAETFSDQIVKAEMKVECHAKGVYVISRRYLTADDIKVCSTPHKILRSHQNSVNPSLEDLEQECSKMSMSTTLGEVQWNHARAVSANDLSQNLNREVKGRRNPESRRELDNQQHILGAVLVTETTGSVSSVGDHHADSACRDFSRSDCEGRNESRIPRKRSICGRAALHFVCCLCIIFLAVVLSGWWIDDDEVSYVVPT
ncbi:uncharacterized protein LOC120112569 [Phoenix dactylifera]|uniref:Uncharacterized protein LOC120112569 n=1 Tax=Phoenix dactylifera TaxID=42345 RepID=A0A8B9ANV8_PHODC|nr:uncharacterized protein LOC120112569 [Phoenix dactylifera]